MKVIKDIVKNIRDELEDAEKYAWDAARIKADHPDLAETYAKLSNAELDHANILHKNAVDLIDKHRREGHEPPAAMKAIWDWEHEKYMEQFSEVKRLLDIYRG